MVLVNFGRRPPLRSGKRRLPTHPNHVTDDPTDPTFAPPGHGDDIGRIEPLVGMEDHLAPTYDGRVSGPTHQSGDRPTFLRRDVADVVHEVERALF